jgi:isochorismate hydrolase
MAQPLLPGGGTHISRSHTAQIDSQRPEEMADLKIFWGPEICRLEYLVHLLDTGRVKDEHWPRTA